MAAIEVNKKNSLEGDTARIVSNYGVFSGLYFPAFGLNTERYGVSNNSVFGHFSRSDMEGEISSLFPKHFFKNTNSYM